MYEICGSSSSEGFLASDKYSYDATRSRHAQRKNGP